MSLRSAPAIVHPVIHLIRMGDSLVLLPRSSLQSARASKKITSEILFGKLRTPSDSFISKNEGMAKAPNAMPLPRRRLVHADRDGSRRPDGARLPRLHAPAGQSDFRHCPTSPAFGRQAAGQPALL